MDKKTAKVAAAQAVEAAVAANGLVEFAAGIGCPVEQAPNGRLGVRKWALEACLHNQFGGGSLDVSQGYGACDPTAHYMCGITESLGRDARVDSARVQTLDANNRARSSTWYFNRQGEQGTRTGGYAAGPSKGDKGDKVALADALLAGDTAKVEEIKAKLLQPKAKASSRVQALEAQLAEQGKQLAALMALLQAK